MRRLRLAILAACALAVPACGGGGGSNPDAASNPDGPDAAPCLCDAPTPDAPVNTNVVINDDFATFPSSTWATADMGSQTGTGVHATGAGNPAPSLDVGDAGDHPDGTALESTATWTSTGGWLLTADLSIPTASPTAGAASQVTITAYDDARSYYANVTFTIQNNTGDNTPFPGPSGLSGSIAGADKMYGTEFQTPISSPDDAFHSLKLSQDGSGNLAWTWDGTSQAVGTGFPSGTTVHLEIAGTHLDPNGTAAPAGSIYVDNVEVSIP